MKKKKKRNFFFMSIVSQWDKTLLWIVLKFASFHETGVDCTCLCA